MFADRVSPLMTLYSNPVEYYLQQARKRGILDKCKNLLQYHFFLNMIFCSHLIYLFTENRKYLIRFKAVLTNVWLHKTVPLKIIGNGIITIISS